MRSWMVVFACGLALVAAACGPARVERAVTRLTCPEMEGRLQRLSVAPDGKSCVYRTADGAEVFLRLVPVTGGVHATLAAMEREVRAMAPPTPTGDKAASFESSSNQPASPRWGRRAHRPRDADEDVDIDLPGLHVSTRGEGVDVKVAGVGINADGQGAVVRWVRDVRLLGEAASRERRGVRALFILAGPEGENQTLVGYLAAGPRTGPLTVALLKWSNRGDDGLRQDLRRLVRRNAGA